MKKVNFEFTITGLILSIIIVSMIAGSTAMFLRGVEEDLGLSGNSTLSNYDQTADIINYSSEINKTTDLTPSTNVFDVLGEYFNSGYNALKISLKSIGLFNNLMNTASEDIEYFAYFKDILIALVMIVITLLVLSVVVKWKV